MTPGYILYFHTDDDNCFIASTLDPVKATLAYRNTIKQKEHHDNVVVELYSAKFEGTDKESLARETIAYANGEFTSVNCSAIAIYTKDEGKILSDGMPLDMNLRPTS